MSANFTFFLAVVQYRTTVLRSYSLPPFLSGHGVIRSLLLYHFLLSYLYFLILLLRMHGNIDVESLHLTSIEGPYVYFVRC